MKEQKLEKLSPLEQSRKEKEEDERDSQLYSQWLKEAEYMTIKGLNKYLKKLINYKHNYNTIAYAMVCGAIATINSIDNSPKGGITGFQAGWVSVNFIKQFNPEVYLSLMNLKNEEKEKEQETTS